MRADQQTFLSIDNRDQKSTAGTPVFVPTGMLTSLTVQRTAVMFTSPLTLRTGTMVVPFSRGVSVRNGRLQALRDDSGLVIESPVISILQVDAHGEA